MRRSWALVATLTMLLAGAVPALAAEGEDLYEQRCSSCHGEEGEGGT